MAWVYILKSIKNSRFYIGSTSDIERRFEEHCSGKSEYTKNILPVRLVFKQEYKNLPEARKMEYWLKRQKDKDLLLKIINEGKINKVIG